MNKAGLVIKRHEKKEVKRVSYINKDKGKMSIIEPKNIHNISRFLLDKGKKDNIKSEEKIIRAEEESKKIEIKKDIEDKYVKNKNKAQISRNIIKERKSKIEENNIKIYKNEDNDKEIKKNDSNKDEKSIITIKK